MWDLPILWTDFFHLFYYFIVYSFMGWCMETCLVSFNSKEFVNRGFMNGPFCPIYGTGASAIYLFLTPLQDHPVLVFFWGMLLATVIEYGTSFVMEKLFHARWWDYSEKKYNLQGRVCLSISLCWGILSLIMLHVFQPVVLRLVDQIPASAGQWLGMGIILYFMVDIFITIKHVLKLNQTLDMLTRIRDDIVERLESSLLYSTAEEARLRLEQLSSSEVLEEFSEKMAVKLESGIENINQFKERMEHLKAELKALIDETRANLTIKSSVEKRLLKAFPNYRSTDYQKAWDELKRHLMSRNK